MKWARKSPGVGIKTKAAVRNLGWIDGQRGALQTVRCVAHLRFTAQVTNDVELVHGYNLSAFLCRNVRSRRLSERQKRGGRCAPQ